ncbi:MAG: ABC transporter permease [Acidobacteria bacterium]|nr:ABC transporter permease [Acidobacteriota bacterium]
MKNRTALWGIVPAAAINVVFFAVPMMFVFVLSFWSTRDFQLIPEWTLRNYLALFRDASSVRILWRTLWMSAVITATVVAFAYPFAYFLVHYTRRWQQLLLVMVVVTFWTSSVLRAYAWMVILAERGILNGVLTTVGLANQSLTFFLYNKLAVIVVGVYFLAPFAVLILYSSLERMDPDLVIAATDLGASPRRAFLHVTLPQTLPGVYTAVFFSFVNALGFFVVPALVGGPESVMMANLVGNLFNSGQLAQGAALSLVIALLVLVAWRAVQRYADFQRI